MNIEEYLRRERQIHAAWAKLNKAADTLESNRAFALISRSMKDLLALESGCIAQLSTWKGLVADEQALLESIPVWENEGTDPGMQNIGKIIPVLWKIIQSEKQQLLMDAPRLPLIARRLVKTAFTVVGIAAAALLIYSVCYIGRLVAYKGCVVTYYCGTEFEQKIGISVEPSIHMRYKGNKPFWYAPASGWSSRWEADLIVPDDNEYHFYTQSDDGLRLYIDGELLVDNWKDQKFRASMKQAQKRLSKGFHLLKVEHYFRSGKAAIRVKWSGGSVPVNTVLAFPYLRKPTNKN